MVSGTDYDSYNFVAKLGEGAFGVVSLMTLKQDASQYFAIKVTHKVF